jgi:hypothetical protein
MADVAVVMAEPFVLQCVTCWAKERASAVHYSNSAQLVTRPDVTVHKEQ